jgi:hypothetical protein
MQDETAKKLAAEIEALEPGLRAKITEEKRKSLSKGQREALDTPLEKRTGKQHELASQADDVMKVTHNEVARRIKGAKREQALKLAKEATDREMLANYIRRYRDIVNFKYWRMRADVEQSDDLLAARKRLFEGDRAYSEGDLIAARDAYKQGMQSWRNVLKKTPDLMPNQTAGDDLVNVIKRYRRILSQLDEPFPQPFILQDVIDFYQKNDPMALAESQEKSAKDTAKKDAEKKPAPKEPMK